MVRLDHNTSKKNNSKAFCKSTRITTELFSYLHKLLLLFVLQEYYKCCLSSLLHTFMSFIMGYKNRTFTTRQGFEQSISLSFPFPSNGKKITAGWGLTVERQSPNCSHTDTDTDVHCTHILMSWQGIGLLGFIKTELQAHSLFPLTAILFAASRWHYFTMHLSQNLTAPMSENRPGRCVSLIHHTTSSWQSLPQEHVKFISESHRHKVAEISLFSSLYREKISNELNKVYQSTERSNFRGAPANPKASILNLK